MQQFSTRLSSGCDKQFSSVEQLESRTLLTAQVVSAFADNRGLFEAVVSQSLNAATVSASTVKIYTAGADGRFGTADDVNAPALVSYDAASRTITAKASVAANTAYRVVLSDGIQNTAGQKLDGEMITPGGVSGDGAPGGNYDVVARAPAGEKIVRFNTDAGIIDVQMYANTPLSVANFLKYADSGRYDNTFIHRMIPGFVAQGGGYFATGPLGVDAVEKYDPVQNEPVNSNVKYTIAFAKLPEGAPGGGANSATNEWFFNLADNSGNLDAQNSGFTAFGLVMAGSSRATMDSLNTYPTVDPDPGSLFDDLPVQPGTTLNTLDMTRDALDVTRISLKMDLSNTTNWVVGATADFNGDGQTDIVWRNYNTGANVLWLMNNGVRTSSILLPSLANKDWQLVGAADMNTDGQVDLIWRNRASGQNTVWLMQNNAIDSFSALPPVVSQNWRLEGVGDLNGDGKTDLVWRNYGNGNNSVWFLNGTTAPANQMKALPPVYNFNYKIQAVGDFNNDGRADVVFRNTLTGQNQLWFFNGNVRTGVKVLPVRIDTAYTIAGAGQFDNRAGSDLLWNNYSTRQLEGWSLSSAGDWLAAITMPAMPG